jgi:hypothetical protein
MTPELLARSLEEFLSESRHGTVVEGGEIIFDLDSARFSISAERGRCLLHMWSVDRNIVREIVESECRNGVLRLTVRKFAQSRTHQLQICCERDRRTSAARKTARTQYARVLERVLQREFPQWNLARLSTSMDLERSFSPVYARALLRKGRSSLAVLGVNQQETQASIDAALTFGLLWLDHCRQSEAGRATVEGLRLYVPKGKSDTLRLRMAHLNAGIGRFQLGELEQADGEVEEKDLASANDLESSLQRCPDSATIRARFEVFIGRIKSLLPDAEIRIASPGEISFRFHGLEFARARLSNLPGTFQAAPELVFGIAPLEEVLRAENEAAFVAFLQRVAQSRTAQGDKHVPVWRMYPERWLESLIVKNVTALDASLNAAHVYSQVPAVSAADRSLIDVLTCTRAGRLAVLELKADEDIHLPVQGLDYWARVKWHHARGDFQKQGYFSNLNLVPEPPLLLLVAPALHVHPAVDTLLRYFSPEIHWKLIGVDERWRDGIKVVFRKSVQSLAAGETR